MVLLDWNVELHNLSKYVGINSCFNGEICSHGLYRCCNLRWIEELQNNWYHFSPLKLIYRCWCWEMFCAALFLSYTAGDRLAPSLVFLLFLYYYYGPGDVSIDPFCLTWICHIWWSCIAQTTRLLILEDESAAHKKWSAACFIIAQLVIVMYSVSITRLLSLQL